jgi:hypothetical protein
MTSQIQVVCRKRPISHAERSHGFEDVVDCDDESVLVRAMKKKFDLSLYIEEQRFIFDHVFGESATNAEVFERSVTPLVDSFVHDGGKCACFCFGQTGSGKTYVLTRSPHSQPPP